MIDPIEKKRRAHQQYQHHIESTNDQTKSVEGAEKIASTQGGRKVQKLSEANIQITNVFAQSMQHLSQKTGGEQPLI